MNLIAQIKKVLHPNSDEKNIGIYGFIFALYVGIGPVYWMPNISTTFFNTLKMGVYIILILFTFLRGFKFSKLYYPGGKAIFFLMCLFLLFSIPGVVMGEKDAALYQLQNIVQIILFVYAAGILIRMEIIKPIVYLTVKIFFVFCLLALFAMIFAPNYPNPYKVSLRLAETGFGGSRTGWSPAISLYIPWVYSCGLFSLFMALAAGSVMFSNQILVASRTGIAANLIPFLTWGFIAKNLKIFFAMLLIVCIFLVYIQQNLEGLRLTRGGFYSEQALNELSSGRWDQYIAAYEDIAKNPLGHGFGSVWYEGSALGVHNVILKAAVEGGIPYASTMIVFFTFAIIRGLKSYIKGNVFMLPALLTVLAGIVTSMLEPMFIFGSFNNGCFWWVCFSICVSRFDVKAIGMKHYNSKIIK